MQDQNDARRALPRVATGIRGFDELTGGGLPANRTCLITGVPGTGKTTFGNQLAFAHAARGGRVIVATLLAETHDVLFENLRGFDFFDERVIGDRVQYLSVLSALMEGGPDATVDTLRREVRKADATLLIIDGSAVTNALAPSDFDLRRFAQQLEAQAVLLGCTTLLLTSTTDAGVDPLWAHVNSVVLLTTRPFGTQQVRMLEVVKMRGVRYTSGGHDFTITEVGMEVFPRLESLVGYRRRAEDARHGLGTGITGLDTMIGGGLMPLSTTLVMGTPGSGKTILGLSFLTEGAARGERGLLVTFHETEADLCTTAERIGLDLCAHVDSGMVRILWHAPLELSVDAWAWHVLAAMEEQVPTRVYIDALTDVHRLITVPERTPMFVTALVNELRNHGATTLIGAEVDHYVSDELAVPVPAASAAMDNCILLRHVELSGQLRRMIAVPKVRQAVSDPSIREIQITDRGMNVAYPIQDTSGLLTGRANPNTDQAGTKPDEAHPGGGR